MKVWSFCIKKVSIQKKSKITTYFVYSNLREESTLEKKDPTATKLLLIVFLSLQKGAHVQHIISMAAGRIWNFLGRNPKCSPSDWTYMLPLQETSSTSIERTLHEQQNNKLMIVALQTNKLRSRNRKFWLRKGHHCQTMNFNEVELKCEIMLNHMFNHGWVTLISINWVHQRWQRFNKEKRIII